MAQLTPPQAIAQAWQNLQAGRPGEAQALCRQILAVQPQQPDALHVLGIIAGQSGDIVSAERLIRQAIAASPRQPHFYNNLGSFLQSAGRVEDALACYAEALRINPDFAESLNNTGAALLDLGRVDDALPHLQRALAARPQYANALNNFANALREKGRLDEAIDAYRQCLALDPDFAEGHNNLGTSLFDQRRLLEAVESYRRSIARRPSFAQAHCNLATALRMLNRLDEAVAEYETALRYDPKLAMAHNNLGVTLLLRGEFERGWREHQWRWLMTPPPSPRRDFSQPEWDGSSIAGRTVLLHSEQGFGDSIQFIRYAPLVAELGARVILECPRPLAKLLDSVRGIDRIIPHGERLPAFDLHCPLMSLPLRFATDLSNIPASIPYLAPPPGQVEEWKARLSNLGAGMKIGIAWAGNPKQQFDRERSLPLVSFAPLAACRHVRFVSLQQGHGASQTCTAPPGLNLIDWTSELRNFADAALIAALDLVITADTSTAHLAGALGKPVWVLLPLVPDWRWLLGRDDSPWYPTMRLFRQTTAGQWDDVIRCVAGELESMETQS